MTDKERYEFAMKENHELREELKQYREVNAVLNSQLVKQAAVIEMLQEKLEATTKNKEVSDPATEM